MNRTHALLLAFGSALTMLLAGCNLPNVEISSGNEGEGQRDAADAELQIQGVTLSEPQLQACAEAELTVQAALTPSESPIEAVRLQYRFVGGEPPMESEWQEAALAPAATSGSFEVTLDRLGQQAQDHSETPPSTLEYWIAITDAEGRDINWPEGKEVFASLPVVACGEIAAPGESPQAQALTIVDYGASPSAIAYGGCEPTDITFELSLEGYQLAESLDVKTTWIVEGGLGESSEHPLEDQGPDPDNPGARRFATTLDFSSGAQDYLGGEAGAVGWNIYVQPAEGASLELPQGGPPTIAVAPCGDEEGGDIAANPTPTATKGPIIVLPLATATPAGPIVIAPLVTPTPTGLVIAPLPLYLSQGTIDEMKEGWYFDLDTAQIKASAFNDADFELDEGDDPYLDQFRPVNGSYVGWFGEDQPSKDDCLGTLKSAAAMTIAWPDKEGTYYCFETSEGHQAWVRLDTWVSLPLFERHLAFTWGTWY